MTSGFNIPVFLTEPRAFILDAVINPIQAYAQAGAYRKSVFKFGISNIGNKVRGVKTTIEPKLLQRRLVPFWHVRCTSHFDYSRLNNYEIRAHHPDAINITVQGSGGQTIEYPVDRSGRSGGIVKFTGVERCNTDREKTSWIDSYLQRDQQAVSEEQQAVKRMQAYVVQNPRQIHDLEEFVSRQIVDSRRLFEDDVDTIVVPPLEPADNVVRRIMKEVMVAIDATTIHAAELRVEKIDLYFRPLFVFQFEKLDSTGNPIERKLEELDALNKDHWTNLETTEFQLSRLPWGKILKLSADIGSAFLQDVPIVGTVVKATSIFADQVPGILDDMP